MTQAEHAARIIASADASDNLEEEALAWDDVQRESRRSGRRVSRRKHSRDRRRAAGIRQ